MGLRSTDETAHPYERAQRFQCPQYPSWVYFIICSMLWTRANLASRCLSFLRWRQKEECTEFLTCESIMMWRIAARSPR